MLTIFYILLLGTTAPSLHSDCDNPFVSGIIFMNRLDLANKTFGRLTVLKENGKKWNNVTWLCKCDCGNLKTVPGSMLMKGITRSCGCLAKELARKRLLKHGMSKSTEFVSWSSMRKRCYDKNDTSYNNYGGRGIKVCDRWLGKNGFINFLSDMGAKPSPIHSLDRFPNNETGNYEPSNCRWATPPEQLRNFRNNLWYEYNGEKMVVTDWEHKWGIPKNSIQAYLRRGRTFEWVYLYFEKRKNNSFFHTNRAFEYAKNNSVGIDLYIYKYGKMKHVSKDILKGQTLIAHFKNGEEI